MIGIRRGIPSQRGQSIAEVMISLPFMMAIVIGLVDTGIAFASYVAEVNAAREGAIFASMYPALADSNCGAIPYPNCVGTIDTNTYSGSTTYWNEYRGRVSNELFVVVGEELRTTGLLTEDTLTLHRPILGPSSTDCPVGNEVGCPITITVDFRIHTLTSDMQLPYFGRFGLPNYYQMSYSFGMPIR